MAQEPRCRRPHHPSIGPDLVNPCWQSPVLTPAPTLLLQPRLKNPSLVLGCPRSITPYQKAASPVVSLPLHIPRAPGKKLTLPQYCFVFGSLSLVNLRALFVYITTSPPAHPNNGRPRNLHTFVEEDQVRHQHHRVELQWLPLRPASVHL
jgi:hypothetical protein